MLSFFCSTLANSSSAKSILANLTSVCVVCALLRDVPEFLGDLGGVWVLVSRWCGCWFHVDVGGGVVDLLALLPADEASAGPGLPWPLL